MSSENTNVHLNILPEVQTQMEGISAEENSSKEHNNIVEEKSDAGNLGNGDLVVEAENFSGLPNIIKEKSPRKFDAKLKSDEVKCDICSTVDVENIANSLSEKVNIKNTDPCNSSTMEEVKFDTGGIETTNENVAEAVVSPEKLISKVFKLNISEVSQQSASQHNESAVILKQQTDSLKNLLVYESSSSDEAEEEDNWQFHSVNKSDSETDVSDSDDTSSSDEDEDDDAGLEPKKAKKHQSKPESPITEDLTLKIYSENNLHDLPPIRDVSNLDIDVEKEEFLHMGHIEAVIETLITVESILGMPAYDLDTCFFVEHQTTKRPLGAVYDVIGPVTSPLYCIRFQYASDIAHLELKKGTKVFCAPKSKFTRYVFVKELMRHKGTDASWVGDIEIPPEIAAELSDDECRSESHEPRKPQKRKHSSQERHRQFEESMNRCNTLNTEAFRYIEAQQHVPRISRYNDQVQRVLFNDIVAQTRLPAMYDPSVPPPGFPRAPSPAVKWHVPATTLRPPRCHLFGQDQSYYPSTYTNNDMNYGPGTSSHPH